MGFLVLLLTVAGYAAATNKCITLGGVTLTHENWHLFTDAFTDGIWASVTSLDNSGNVYQAQCGSPNGDASNRYSFDRSSAGKSVQLFDTLPCSGALQITMGAHGEEEQDIQSVIFKCQSADVKVGHQYKVEMNFDGGLSLADDSASSAGLWQSYQGDKVAFYEPSAWDSQSLQHYRFSFLVMAKECDDNIISPTAGNSPSCGVTQVSQYFNATEPVFL